MRIRAAVVLVAVSVGLGCGSPAARPPEIDCGVNDAGYDRYDPGGRDCFWNAYSSGRSVTWGITQRTIEGAPIPSTITYDPPLGITVTRDARPDAFSGQEHRRLWTWKCDGASLTAGTSTEAFRLTGCRGDGTSSDYQTRTGFP